jgi:hypothetical protein
LHGNRRSQNGKSDVPYQYFETLFGPLFSKFRLGFKEQTTQENIALGFEEISLDTA